MVDKTDWQQLMPQVFLESIDPGKLVINRQGEKIILIWDDRMVVMDLLNRKMCCYRQGKLHDPAPGVPAFRRWYPSMRLELEVHFFDGKPHDPARMLPAYRRYSECGRPVEERHYYHGRLQNPGPFVPAVKRRNDRGKIEYTADYENGKRIRNGAVL